MGAGQPHVPAMQLVAPVQAMPQAPQFVALWDRSTQLPAHRFEPVGHVTMHAPLLHTMPAAQVVPQAPQFFGSVVSATHTPPQR